MKNRQRNIEEDVNPLDGLANLADIMLVLVCGLMLALINNWNIDIGETAGGVTDVTRGQEVSENLRNSEDGAEGESPDVTGYEKMGIVYKDPSTGKLYMVTSDE